MIGQKFRVVFQISQLANIPQKWFGTQNGPLDIRSQMRKFFNAFEELDVLLLNGLNTSTI